MNEEFENEWLKARRQVLAYCSRVVGNLTDAEDVTQRVAIRAWRGYPAFRRDASFLTWVLTIARREIVRGQGRMPDVSLDQVIESNPEHSPAVQPLENRETNYNWLAESARGALAARALTETETQVVLERLSSPDVTWDQVGEKVGMDGATCAVIHCRAIPKLRVFLFLQHTAVLGGIGSISQAFQSTLSSSDNPMSNDEADVFRRVVLERERNYRRNGLKPLLRSACAKVIKWLPTP
jgi:RNA polymerase sigma factor (sigma-70 family)